MKRASAERASLGNDSGLATGRAEHAGLRPEDAALLSDHRLDPPAAIETLFGRYHEAVNGASIRRGSVWESGSADTTGMEG